MLSLIFYKKSFFHAVFDLQVQIIYLKFAAGYFRKSGCYRLTCNEENFHNQVREDKVEGWYGQYSPSGCNGDCIMNSMCQQFGGFGIICGNVEDMDIITAETILTIHHHAFTTKNVCLILKNLSNSKH